MFSIWIAQKKENKEKLSVSSWRSNVLFWCTTPVLILLILHVNKSSWIFFEWKLELWTIRKKCKSTACSPDVVLSLLKVSVERKRFQQWPLVTRHFFFVADCEWPWSVEDKVDLMFLSLLSGIVSSSACSLKALLTTMGLGAAGIGISFDIVWWFEWKKAMTIINNVLITTQ